MTELEIFAALAACSRITIDPHEQHWGQRRHHPPVPQSVLSALIRLADARYLSRTACLASRLGAPCAIAATNFVASAAATGCALVIPAGAPGPASAARSSLLARAAPCACAAGLEEFLHRAGCCAATAAAAQGEWATAIGGHPALGRQFAVEWADGRREELLLAPAACPPPGGGPAGVACGPEPCGLLWPEACCGDLQCANGGVKEHPAACGCACARGWTGADCSVQAAHARVALVVEGLGRRKFEALARRPLLATIAKEVAQPARQKRGRERGRLGGRRGEDPAALLQWLLLSLPFRLLNRRIGGW